MRTASKIISWIFLPLFMPVYGLLLGMYFPSESIASVQSEGSLFHMPPQFKYHILLLFVILSVIAPGFSLLMLKRQKRINSVEMDDKEERSFPISLTVIYCGMLGIFILMQVPKHAVPLVIFSLPWAGVLASSLAGLINRYEKISLHAMGAGMLFGFLVVYFSTQSYFDYHLVILSALLGGVIMSARMFLGKHSLRECVSGYVLGFLAVFLVLTFFPNFPPYL